jgi:hypothetical protein
MATRKTAQSSSVYLLRITLLEIAPPIWRRILVQGNTKLPDLHLMFQAAMGWYNSHLHLFEVHGTRYGEPDPDFDDDDTVNEKAVRLDKLLGRKGARMMYLYDFGDGWEHDVRVEDIFPADPKVKYPVCVEGKRACPPEDVGGTWGYAEFLEAIADPKHEEHGRMLEWIGGKFDSEEFDVAATNLNLQKYKSYDLGG